MPKIDQVQLAFPVFIEVPGATGSGFYLNDEDAIYLVTARHVLFKKGIETHSEAVILTSLDGADVKKNRKVVFKLNCLELMQTGFLTKHAQADVAVCKIASLTIIKDQGRFHAYAVDNAPGVISLDNDLTIRGLPRQQTARFDEVDVGDDILLFGYPSSLANDALDRSLPLLRSGIVAGKTNASQIVIDCPVYYGNSGGLVAMPVAHGALICVGVASRMVYYVEKTYSPRFDGPVALRHENSGYALVEPIDRVFELIDEIRGAKSR